MGKTVYVIKDGPWSAKPIKNVMVTEVQERDKNGERLVYACIGQPPAMKKVPYGQKFFWSDRIPSANCHFWDKHPAFFVAIPKNATCSIQWSLPEEIRFGHMYAKHFPDRIRGKLKTIVRNPYDRLVSAYLFVVRGGFNQNKHYLAIRDNYQDFEDWVLRGLDFRTIQFFNWRADEAWKEPFILQKNWLVDDRGCLMVPKENWGRFENLEEDTHRLFGIHLKKTLNQSTGRKSWEDYYINPKVKEKVRRLYTPDFALLGYPK